MTLSKCKCCSYTFDTEAALSETYCRVCQELYGRGRRSRITVEEALSNHKPSEQLTKAEVRRAPTPESIERVIFALTEIANCSRYIHRGMLEEDSAYPIAIEALKELGVEYAEKSIEELYK